ncbi:MAG: hypothetical protein U5L04_13205 [Trueperaceae bacterium]|nr:hypothetical protein [Trueperaceae bacterium]
MTQPNSDHTLLLELIRSLDLAMLVETDDDYLRTISPAPTWLSRVLPGDPEQLRKDDACDFLANFLVDAHAFWQMARPGKLRSGFWIERDDNDREQVFEASAFRLEAVPILLVERAPNAYDDAQKVIQTGREIITKLK